MRTKRIETVIEAGFESYNDIGHHSLGAVWALQPEGHLYVLAPQRFFELPPPHEFEIEEEFDPSEQGHGSEVTEISKDRTSGDKWKGRIDTEQKIISIWNRGETRVPVSLLSLFGELFADYRLLVSGRD